jgi:tRNA G18 (ribose-2'-O)-methylase SpoU
MEELGRLSVKDFKKTEKTPVIIVLEDVRSALNVGSAFRTADAFALQRVVLTGITATPPHREILKTALGSTDTVEWAHFDDIETALQTLKTEKAASLISFGGTEANSLLSGGLGGDFTGGVKIFAVEQVERSISLENIETNPNETYVLIFGNEVDGVSETAIKLADGVIEVPQFGTKHSLNVAVTVGIVAWELTKKIRMQ